MPPRVFGAFVTVCQYILRSYPLSKWEKKASQSDNLASTGVV